MVKVTKYSLMQRIKELEQDNKQEWERILSLTQENSDLREQIKQLEQVPQLESQKINLEILKAEEAELQEHLDIIRDALLKIPTKDREKFVLLIKAMAKVTPEILQQNESEVKSNPLFGYRLRTLEEMQNDDK